MRMDTRALAKRYEELLNQKKAVAKQEADNGIELNEVEQRLFDAMVDDELQSMKLDSGLTLYRRIDEFPAVAEGHTKEELVEALANHEETRDLVSVTYNSNSLRSRIKEIESNGETLPEEIRSLLAIHQKFRIGYRS